MKNVPKKNKVLVVKNLDELQDLIDAPVMVKFRVDEQEVELPVKRANPVVLEKCRAIERAVQPPWNEKRKDYDPLDPKYLDAKDAARDIARSFKVYSCCSAVAAKKPSLTDEKDIHAFVKTVLTGNLLDLIALAADAGGLNISEEVQKRANFTFTPGSES